MATTQSYAKHTHNPRPTGVAGAACLLAIVLLLIVTYRSFTLQNVALLVLCVAVMTLVGISRGYTVRLQDRIIRLEMQVRLARLGLESQFGKLSMRQIVALRFASDAELPALIDRALREQLDPDQIKRAVTDWQPDLYRT